MSNYLERKTDAVPLSVTNALGTTGQADISKYSTGKVIVPTGSALTTLTFYAADQKDGTYVPIYNGTTAVTLTVAAGRAYSLPADVMGFKWIKIVGSAVSADGVELILQS